MYTYARITALLALASYLVTYLFALDFSVRSDLMAMEQSKESQNNISARPRQATPHSPAYFQGALPIRPQPRYKPYSTYRFYTALPSLCGERKPEEEASRKSSPFNSQPSWNLQPAEQPELATNLLRPVYFQCLQPIHPFDFYKTNSTFQFPTALPSPCAEPIPKQKAAREEGMRQVNDFQTQPDGSSQPQHKLTSSVGKVTPLPTVIDTSDFPGQFNFEILFENEKPRPAKCTPWTFSPSLGKLFAKMNSMVPIAVRLKVYPGGYYVRLVAVFKESEHRLKTVQTCANHRSNQNGDQAPQHLVKCENPETLYITCPVTMRHFLVIPLETPQAGCDFVTNMFHFTCFNSCSGGPNRRRILVVFTLEHDNILVGRKVIEVRVCSCPGRDRTKEEAKNS